MPRIRWSYIDCAKEAMSYCNSGTPRFVWEMTYQIVRLGRRLEGKILRGEIGQIYGVSVYRSEP